MIHAAYSNHDCPPTFVVYQATSTTTTRYIYVKHDEVIDEKEAKKRVVGKGKQANSIEFK